MHTCVQCSRDILPPSPVATYEDKYYHPECLRCDKCRKSLSGKQFIKEKTGTLMCEECNEKYSPKCKRCGKSFGAGQTYKKIGDDAYYHNECFKCAGPCRKPIVAEFYDLENDRFLCTDCYDKYGTDAVTDTPAPPPPISEPPQRYNANSTARPAPPSNPPPPTPVDKAVNHIVSRFDISLNDKPAKTTPGVESLPAFERTKHGDKSTPAPAPAPSSGKKEDMTCAKCGLQLTGTFTVFNERKYHSACFVCCQCGQEFTDKSFYKLNDQPLCRTCHSKNLVSQSSKCKKCNQPILDTVVTFKSGEYHDYCLVCSECDKKLVGQSIYTDKQDRPFCVECFTRKEGKKCGKCGGVIAPNQSNLVFEGKNFHKECFTCSKCSRPISSSESFYRNDDGNDGIICEACIN